MSHYKNISSIKEVYKFLGEYGNKVIFVGGAVVSMYADRVAEEVRPTEDVDILVELYSAVEFGYFEEKLRLLGFRPDTTAKFIGRYKIENITVDVMPLKGKSILGFENIWYKYAFKNFTVYRIENDISINILHAPLFISTKLEAFKNRGSGDGRISEDFEDIVFVFENRNAIWNEMSNAELLIKRYLQKEFAILLNNQYFEEWISAHSSLGSAKNILQQLFVFTGKS